MKLPLLQKMRQKLSGDPFIYSEKKLIKQKKYLKSLKEPNDMIERSYSQYLCQKYFNNNVILNLIDNFMGKILFKKYIEQYAVKESIVFKDKTLKKVAVYFNVLGSKIIPQELKDEYDIIDINFFQDNELNKNDIEFIDLYRKRYKNAHYFNFKIMCKIARYSAIINKFHPDAIIATSEYSFTSSILTEYCRKNNVQHINIMHGEKLFDINASFFEFDKCYVWDQHYIKLLTELRAETSQFSISVPDSLKFDIKMEKKTVDFKFYLEIESRKKLKKLKKVIDILTSNGKIVIVRPHPLYNNIKLLQKYVDSNIIEDYANVPIYKSLAQTNFIVARYSTVLYQIYLSGGNAVIDDITNPKYFKMLKFLDYIMMSKEHELLSDVIK